MNTFHVWVVLGIEPTIPVLQALCSTNCATGWLMMINLILNYRDNYTYRMSVCLSVCLSTVLDVLMCNIRVAYRDNINSVLVFLWAIFLPQHYI